MSSPHIPNLLNAKAALSEAFLSPSRSSFRKLTLLLESMQAPPVVHAVGIGRKVRNGEKTKTLAVRVYVTRKVGIRALAESQKIPESVNGVPTDVIEAPMAVFISMSVAGACTLNRKMNNRPVTGGISTSHLTGDTGTIGYFCQSKEDSASDVFVLSNEHIYGYGKLGAVLVGDSLIQQGALDGGASLDRIASYHRGVPLVFGGGRNEVDAAIGKLDSTIGYKAEICLIGKVTGTVQGKEDDLVAKHGRTSGYTEGIIDDELIDFIMLPKHSSSLIQFRDQMRIIPTASYKIIAEGGDSGSLVVLQDEKDAVGLLHSAAIDGSYAYANHIDKVLSKLNIALL